MKPLVSRIGFNNWVHYACNLREVWGYCNLSLTPFLCSVSLPNKNLFDLLEFLRKYLVSRSSAKIVRIRIRIKILWIHFVFSAVVLNFLAIQIMAFALMLLATRQEFAVYDYLIPVNVYHWSSAINSTVIRSHWHSFNCMVWCCRFNNFPRRHNSDLRLLVMVCHSCRGRWDSSDIYCAFLPRKY